MVFLVAFPDATARKELPLGVVGRSGVATYLQFCRGGLLVLQSADHVHEVLQVVLVQLSHGVAHGQRLVHQVAPHILEPVSARGVLRNHIATHVEGQVHDAALLGVLQRLTPDIAAHQPVEQEEQQHNGSHGDGGIEDDGRGVVVMTLGVEPLIAQQLDVA